jgi:hypothetical protein
MRRIVLGLIALVCLAGSFEHAYAKSAPSAMVAARQRFFGSDNVDGRSGRVTSDRVIFSWLTNATFAAAVNGHVVLLDSFVTRLEVVPGRTPFVIQDLVNLQPEAIFLGHGHFDHADNAAYIAALTGATIYATPETCDNMAIDATNNFNNHYTTTSTVKCVSLTSRGSLPGAEVVSVRDLEGVDIKVFKHLHSTNTGLTDLDAVPLAATVNGVCTPTASKGNTFPCNLQDPRDPALFPAGTLLEPATLNIATSRQGSGGPLSLAFVFTLRGEDHHGFRFVWHNTTGDILDSCALPNNNSSGQPNVTGQDARGCFPGVTVNGKTVGANLASIMASFAPVDVEVGSVVSLGFNQNGERDVVTYMEQFRPKTFIPNHVTAVAVEGSSLEWKVGFFDALKARNFPAAGLQVDWLVDPNDYGRPIAFDVKHGD